MAMNKKKYIQMMEEIHGDIIIEDYTEFETCKISIDPVFHDGHHGMKITIHHDHKKKGVKKIKTD